jgi:hypothetical protein
MVHYLSPVRVGVIVLIGAVISTSVVCRSTERQIERREADKNRNGRAETFTYWDGFHVVRIEIDQDEDGKIDRWEHYDANSRMTRIGSSSRDDAIEDTWSYPDHSGLSLRVEYDANRDGTIDKREIYVPRPGAPQLRVLSTVELELDATGKPGRRIYYTPDGNFDRSEVLR